MVFLPLQQNLNMVTVISVWTIWHLMIEIRQIHKATTFTQYLDFWNVLDWIRIFSQVSYVIINYETRDNSYDTSFVFLTLFSWICILQYLQVFQEFRYLSRLLLDCLKDTIAFLVLLILIIIGFALAFYWLNKPAFD
jgi:hypothetical protein